MYQQPEHTWPLPFADSDANGRMTTVYIGDYYEKTGSAVKKYYSLGGQRVAMDDNGTVRYLLTDHLGSTSKTINSNATVYGELR